MKNKILKIISQRSAKTGETLSVRVVSLLLIVGVILPSTLYFLPGVLHAQIANSNTDPFSQNFSLIVCDGPALPKTLLDQVNSMSPDEFRKQYGHALPYKPCNFFTLMEQVQHFINIAIILGVLAAIIMLTIAGYFYISPKSGDKERARKIFPKLFWGFIIMLSAWFIVYQILEWLAKSQFRTLLGNP